MIELPRVASAGPVPAVSREQEGGRLGLPADFLIDRDGRVLAEKHGEHAYDQWSADELPALVSRAARPRRC
ncbi:hypothetical protein [Allokutzneria albata]|uniref:hypothetical protein n=1 Tax=Allokutzneria albata TaxID=211114 RepID=UPI0004C46944|nr:hypothetical protein [Allokutzneria albata]